ncbi:MAG: hypothetical protein ABTA16_03215 [Niallia sp.]
MKRKRIAVVAIGLMVIFGFGLLWNKPVYGNDEASIKKLIAESDLLQVKTNIEIIDIVDTETNRIVGFTNGEGQGIIRFEKDSKGNYTYLGMNFESGASNGITTYTVPVDNRRTPLFLFLSDGSTVGTIELFINNQLREEKSISLGNFSMGAFQERLSEAEAKAFSLEFKLYKKEGKEITEIES